MHRLRDGSPIVIPLDAPAVAPSGYPPWEVFDVKADIQRDQARDQPLFQELQGQKVRHLPHDKPRLFEGIGRMQHLAVSEAVFFRTIGLNLRNRAALLPEGVIDEKLRIDPEKAVEKLRALAALLSESAAGDVPHREEVLLLQLPLHSPPKPPKIRERAVVPELFPIGAKVQLRDPHTVLIRCRVLCDDIHRNLCEIQIRPDAAGRRDSALPEHLPDHPDRKRMRSDPIGRKIIRDIDENLVDRIDMDILFRDKAEINFIDLRAVLHVERHPGSCDDVIDGERGVRGKLLQKAGGAAKLCPRRPPPSLIILLLHAGGHLEKTGPSGDSQLLKGRCHRKADRLLRPGTIRDDEIGPERVQSPAHALHRRKKRFQIDREIAALPRAKGFPHTPDLPGSTAGCFPPFLPEITVSQNMYSVNIFSVIS